MAWGERKGRGLTKGTQGNLGQIMELFYTHGNGGYMAVSVCQNLRVKIVH